MEHATAAEEIANSTDWWMAHGEASITPTMGKAHARMERPVDDIVDDAGDERPNPRPGTLGVATEPRWMSARISTTTMNLENDLRREDNPDASPDATVGSTQNKIWELKTEIKL